jgi:hypothetical protein
MKASTGRRAAFLNNPRSKFAQLTKDCWLEGVAELKRRDILGAASRSPRK